MTDECNFDSRVNRDEDKTMSKIFATMYNPDTHKLVSLDEYHVIKKSDVDGDVMGALDDFRQFLEYEWHGTAYCKGSTGEDIYEARLTRSEISELNTSLSKIRNALIAQSEPDTLTIEDYKAVIEDHKRLVRELDYALNGEGASEQASLCDIVCQVESDPDMVRIPSDKMEEIAAKQHILWEQYLGRYGDYYPNNKAAFVGCLKKAINDVLNYKEGV